jgi:hypothetical protein
MQRLDNIVFGLSFLVILFLGFHFGVAVEFFDFPDFIIDLTYLFFSIGMGTIGLIKARNLKQFNVRIFNGIIIFISFISTLQSTIHLFFSYHFIPEGSHLFILFFLLLVGLSRKLSQSLETSLHPALVFVLSFALLIFFGTSNYKLIFGLSVKFNFMEYLRGLLGLFVLIGILHFIRFYQTRILGSSKPVQIFYLSKINGSIPRKVLS